MNKYLCVSGQRGDSQEQLSSVNRLGSQFGLTIEPAFGTFFECPLVFRPDLLGTDAIDATIDDERIICAVHDDTSPVDELDRSVSKPADRPAITRVNRREAEQLAMDLEGSWLRFEVIRSGRSEVSPFESGELFVAVGGIGVCNTDAMVVCQTEPARVETPVTAPTE